MSEQAYDVMFFFPCVEFWQVLTPLVCVKVNYMSFSDSCENVAVQRRNGQDLEECEENLARLLGQGE